MRGLCVGVGPTGFKTGEETTLVLVPMAMQILDARKKTSTGEWVFAGKGQTGHLVEPKSAWKRICERAKIGNVRMHDLRRTLGSWQAMTGASLLVIGKSLGQSSVEATKVYARFQLDPIRQSVERTTAEMMLAGNVAGLLPS